MKKLIFRFLVFMILPVIVIVAVEIPYNYMPKIYITKNAYLDVNAGSIETLFVGNSQTMMGIIPEIIDSNGYNAALTVQSFYYSGRIIEKYQKDFKNLKHVVLNISYPSLYSRHREDESYIFYYAKHFSISRTWSITEKLAVKNIPPKQLFFNVYRYYSGKSESGIQPVNNTGMYIRVNSEPFDSLNQTNVLVRSHTRMIGDQYFADNLEDLIYLTTLLQEMGVTLSIIKTPEHSSYLNQLDPVVLEHIDSVIANILNDCKRCSYYDFSMHEQFRSDEFYEDAIHLNLEGATRFSEILRDSLFSRKTISDTID